MTKNNKRLLFLFMIIFFLAIVYMGYFTLGINAQLRNGVGNDDKTATLF